MFMRIFLIRHGDTVIGPDRLYPEDGRLTALGVRQATATANTLASADVTHIVSSGLIRSIETARALGEIIGIKTREVDGFDEVRIGSLRKAPIEVIEKRIHCSPPVADFSEFGGENASEFNKRVLLTLSREIIDKYKNSASTVAAFLHGGTISVILDYAEGRHFNGDLYREIPNCSIALVTVDKSGLRIEQDPNVIHLKTVGITQMYGTQTSS